MKKVSIIIPVFNGKKYIARSVESALSQTYKNIEVIVVDDGSTDKTLEICKKIQNNDPRLVIVKKKNGGVSSARNFGIEKAAGDYIFFLDADDYLDAGVIEKLVVENSKKPGLVSCAIEAIYDYGAEVLKRNKVYAKDEFYRRVLNNTLQGFACGYLFETDICREVLFDQNLIYCEDLVFVAKYIETAKIKKIYFVDKENGVLHYVQNNNSATKSIKKMSDNLSSMRDALRMFDDATNYSYSQQTINKQVFLYESELQKINKTRDYRVIAEKFSLPKYRGGSLRYKLFSFLYQKKMSIGMFLYYKLRGMLQFLKRRLV